MRLHTKRGIRLGLAVGIELFLGYVLVAPLGGLAAECPAPNCMCCFVFMVDSTGDLTPLAVQVQEGCMWAAFTRSGLAC